MFYGVFVGGIVDGRRSMLIRLVYFIMMVMFKVYIYLIDWIKYFVIILFRRVFMLIKSLMKVILIVFFFVFFVILEI